MSPSNPPTPRKRPVQARSKQTYAAILEAATRVLVTDGFDKLTTNKVAEVAGVSIGSLYQYFSNKEELIQALAAAHIESKLERFATLSKESLDLPTAEATRHLIRALVQSSMVDSELHMVLATECVHLGAPLLEQFQGLAESVVEASLRQRSSDTDRGNLALAAFFLVSAVDAVILRALTIRKGRFEIDEIEDELVTLVLRYLTGGDLKDESE